MVIAQTDYDLCLAEFKEKVLNNPKVFELYFKSSGMSGFIGLSINLSISLFSAFAYLYWTTSTLANEPCTYILPTLIFFISAFGISMPFSSLVESSIDGLLGCMLNDQFI